MQLMGLSDILQLGHPRLYETCSPVLESELKEVTTWVAHLDNAMNEIREQYNFGRGIAAPQLGIMKRLVYINIDQPRVIINPEFVEVSNKMFELWDDCMSFPNLLVKVQRHSSVHLRYRDEHWQEQEWQMEDDLSELIQHEVDHLDGVLCTMRAIDQKSFRWRR